jgi:hypothetical protein
MKLTILVQNKKGICFGCEDGIHWERKRIKGEVAVDIPPTTTLAPTLHALSDLLNSENALAGVEVHILYAQHEVDALRDAPETLATLKCSTWQILRLEPLLACAVATSGVGPASPLEDDDRWLKTVLLPILASTFAYSNQAFQAEEARARHEHEETMDTLRADVQAKHQEVARLQARINALQLPGVEHLLVYLPAIYRNFWGVVRPDELALLAGTLTVPVIASPYPDPSPDTVVMLKRRFLQLPELDRERVLEFCRELPHRLDVRVEMKDLFGEM